MSIDDGLNFRERTYIGPSLLPVMVGGFLLRGPTLGTEFIGGVPCAPGSLRRVPRFRVPCLELLLGIPHFGICIAMGSSHEALTTVGPRERHPLPRDLSWNKCFGVSFIEDTIHGRFRARDFIRSGHLVQRFLATRKG